MTWSIQLLGTWVPVVFDLLPCVNNRRVMAVQSSSRALELSVNSATEWVGRDHQTIQHDSTIFNSFCTKGCCLPTMWAIVPPSVLVCRPSSEMDEATGTSNWYFWVAQDVRPWESRLVLPAWGCHEIAQICMICMCYKASDTLGYSWYPLVTGGGMLEPFASIYISQIRIPGSEQFRHVRI